MFGTIRKHQTWLWAVIITLTIISFVIFFSPNARVRSGRGGTANYGSINGQPITHEQLENAQRDLMLLYFFFLSGQEGPHFPGPEAKARGFDLEREQYQWLLLVQEQERLGIHVSSETAGQFAREMLLQLSHGNPITVQQFAQQVLARQGLTTEDFDRFCRHFLGRQQLANLIGMSGKLLTPQDAKEAYTREFQELNTSAVFFSASNYLNSVTVTPEALSAFYSNQLANYRIPPRRQVEYVKFGVSNYLSQAQSQFTNLTELVDMTLQRMGTNYTVYGATTNAAKAKIREEYLHERAMGAAKLVAGRFADALLDLEHGTVNDLVNLAKTNGLTAQLSAPFDEKEPPAGLEVGADFVNAAFRRTPAEPFSGAVKGQDGYYVFALAKEIPSEIPSLSQVKDRVTADYKLRLAWDKARQAGQAAEQTLTNAIAQGKKFDEACAAAGLKPVALPPFSLSTRSLPENIEERISLGQLKQMAFSTPVGKASGFLPTREGGVILAVTGKVPLSDAKMQTDLPAFIRMESQRRQEEAFNMWFRQEAQKGLRDTPLARPQQQPPNMTPSPAPAAKS
jgi:hypothetical protein